VTHFGVTAADMDRVVAAAAEVLRNLPPPPADDSPADGTAVNPV
jgi:hypothetical protein